MNAKLRRSRPGLTLVELLVVLVILAIMTVIAVQATDSLGEQARYEATQRALSNIQDAIVGPANQRGPDGGLLVTGFVADMGRLPQTVDGTSDPLRELWDPSVVSTTAIYGQQQFPSVAAPTAVNSSAWLQNAPGIPVVVTMPCGWRGPYLQLGAGSAGRLLDGYGNPFNSMFQPPSGAPTIMAIGGQPLVNGQPSTSGTPNPFPVSVNVVCSRGADNVLDTSAPSAYKVDQYAPSQLAPPLWPTVAPLVPAPTPLSNLSTNTFGSVSVTVQTVSKFTQPTTTINPIAVGETTPTVRVVLYAPVGGVLNAFVLDSATVVAGVPTLNLMSPTNAVDFSLLADASSLTPLLAPPAPPTVDLTGAETDGKLLAGKYFVKYQDFVGSIARTPSLESSSFEVVAGKVPKIIMPAAPAGVTSRILYLTPQNGASNTETFYTSVNADATSVMLPHAYIPGGAPPTSSASVFGIYLNVPIGPRAIQAFQYEAAPGVNNLVVTKRSPLTYVTVPAGGTTPLTLVLQ